MMLPKYRKWLIIIGGFLMMTILLLVAVPFLQSGKQAHLTQAAAEQQVLDQYKGKIVETTAQGNDYVVKLQSNTGVYEIMVAGDGTGITGIRAMKRSSPAPDTQQPTETSPNKAAKPKPPAHKPSTEPSKNPAVLLTEQEASKHALDEVPGRVQDVDLEQIKGKWYYIVEIDTPKGREADVQVNAASGVISSVTWDDDHDDSKDDD